MVCSACANLFVGWVKSSAIGVAHLAVYQALPIAKVFSVDMLGTPEAAERDVLVFGWNWKSGAGDLRMSPWGLVCYLSL